MSAEPVWYNGKGLTHARCMDWSEQPFPFDWELDRLRRLSRALRRTLRAIDDAGVWLAGVKARWPLDARLRLDQWAVKRVRVGEAVRDAIERVGKLK
jgi:hypothetical protein